MTVELDENLPRRVAPLLTDAGHDVDSVHDEGLAGAPDPEVAASIEIDDLRGCVAVWRDGMLRVRRPPAT